jgi:L-iditol 2-dehydrogenase
MGHNGAFAEYIVATADSLHRAPAGIDPRAAALSEPLAVALHGLTLARLPVDPSAMRILVSGAGPLGLLVIAALVDRGATDIVVAEPAEARRAQALAAGARVAVVPGDLPTPPEMPTQPAEPGFDAAFETSGRGPAIGAAVGLLRPAGTLVLLGTGTMSVTIDPIRILFNELVVTGAYCYDATGIDDALELLATGRLPIDALLSPTDVGLDELLATMQRLRTGEHSRKAMVRPHA